MARKTRGFAQWLALLTVVAFVVRVTYALVSRQELIPFGGDAAFYSYGANLLVDGRGFVEPLTATGFIPIQQSASHPPLYLLFLAIASFVDPGVHTSALTHILWTCVLGSGTVVVLGLAGREIAGPRCGLVAAAIAALYPNMWVHDGALLSETMSLFTVAMVILLSYRFWRRPNGGTVAWLGLWCGLAALSRAELVLAIPLLLVPLVLLTRPVALTRRLRWIVLGGTVAAVTLAPWVVFNMSRFDEPVYLSTGYGRTLAAANCDATYSGPSLGYKNYDCITQRNLAALTPDMDPSEQDKAVRKETMKYIRAHLDRVPVVVAARWGRITGLYRPWDEVTIDRIFTERERWVAELSLFSYYVVAAFAIGGGVALHRRGVLMFPLLVPPVVVLISVALTFAQHRYRAPAEASLVLLAAVAIDALRRDRMARRRPAQVEDEPELVSA